MKLTYDTSTLIQLSQQLKRTGAEFGNTEIRRAFKSSLRPVLGAAKQYVPVGKVVRISTKTRTTRLGKTKRSGSYDRGGATKRDLRIKVVEGRGQEFIRGLVGVDKRRGHVGWRSPFTTQGTRVRATKKGYNRGSVRSNDYLDRAERVGVPLVVAELGTAARNIVRRALSRFAQ